MIIPGGALSWRPLTAQLPAVTAVVAVGFVPDASDNVIPEKSPFLVPQTVRRLHSSYPASTAHIHSSPAFQLLSCTAQLKPSQLWELWSLWHLWLRASRGVLFSSTASSAQLPFSPTARAVQAVIALTWSVGSENLK
jgi:hypothetical protein